MGAIRESVRLRERDAVRAVDAHDAREPGVTGDRLDGILERLHDLNLRVHRDTEPPRGLPVPCAVMTTAVQLTRRAFLTDLGRGAVALTIVGIAGCAPSAVTSSAGGSSASPQSTGGASSTSAGSPEPAASSAPPSEPAASGGAVTWERANLGFVSAYVLVRGGEAAIVDTGVAGSEDAIGEALDDGSASTGPPSATSS